ncbi:MAG: flagellar hook-associated protein FlgK [Gammaproteobacteria bacterium]|nr:flagellar hook-associated protein FlgK [Gammaproteobacteria bacterium]MBU1488598.1 flagellar hook-associated protein FlgK [Gammaproteobacteria bacterium]MBU2064723.1 flagellar hook-associated protein FlgK [Gammaproteobacteria bacterium]MBU2137986.1 flagellar hook-associated protein FlgK [Gammaproteobacteria bacterium]MBU2215126.1 flagellar hook-associated protein FlgK [Gammaproteobacteria bacterium]
MADLLNIGLSGLSANKTSLAVTGHNITNVNTPGYSRQDAVQATRVPQFSGVGFIGSGTTLVDIRRTYSEFLSTQVRSSTALSADVEAYKAQIEQLDSLLAGSTTGITPSLQSFFSALQTAAEDPANIPARQLVLSEAEGLAKRFNVVYDRVSEQNEFINKQMTAVTEQVNRLATSIASYNDAISIAAANGKQPNDLLDARDEAVRQLSTYVGVTVVAQDDNAINVFVGSGQPLVVGSTASRLEAVAGSDDPTRFEIEFVSGGSRQGVTSLLTGGELGGLIRYRSETLDPTLNSIGRLALAVSDQVNSQLGQGLDLKGQVGAALFGDFNDPATAQLRVRAFSTNTSNVQPALNITDTSILTTSDYRLEFDGTQYSARRLSDGATLTVNPNPPATYPAALSFTDSSGRDQGFEIALDSAPAADDRYLLQPTRRGATAITAVLDQPDQLAFAAPVRSDANVQNRGTATIGQPALQSTGSDIDPTTLQAALPVTLTYDAVAADFTVPAGATLTRINPNDGTPATPATFQSGQQNTYELELSDGSRVRMTLSGRPENGDTFNLSFNQNGVSDNRNALALADLQSKATVGVDPTITGISTGSSFVDSYGDTVERVGTLTAQARQDSLATASILKQATDNRDSLSAVNLDEEAANLIKFEQYYNASAQVIQVARSLFDTLIGAFR